MSSSRGSAGERSIGKASTLEDSAVDFQHVFLLFLEEEHDIYAATLCQQGLLMRR